MVERVLLENQMMTASQEKQMVGPTLMLWRKSETPAFEVESDDGGGGMTPVTGMSSDADDVSCWLKMMIWVMMLRKGCQEILWLFCLKNHQQISSLKFAIFHS